MWCDVMWCVEWEMSRPVRGYHAHTIVYIPHWFDHHKAATQKTIQHWGRMLSRYIRSLHTFEATISYSMDGIDALPISLFVFSHYSIFEPVRTICSRSTVPLSSPLPLSPCAKVFLAENSKVPFTPLLFMVVVVPLCLLVCRFSFSISTTHFFYWFKSFCIFRIFFQQFGVLSSPLTHSRSRFHFLYIPHSLALELLVEVEVCKLFLYIVTISVCRRRYRRVCCLLYVCVW